MTPTAGTLRVNIDVDTRFEAALKNLSRAMEGVGEALLNACQRRAEPFGGFLMAAEVAFHPDGHEVGLAGQEGRFYAQGAMHPRYSDSPDALVQRLSRLRALTPEHRATLMVATLRGWVTHHSGPAPEVLVHHRAYGDTVVMVQREATA